MGGECGSLDWNPQGSPGHGVLRFSWGGDQQGRDGASWVWSTTQGRSLGGSPVRRGGSYWGRTPSRVEGGKVGICALLTRPETQASLFKIRAAHARGSPGPHEARIMGLGTGVTHPRQVTKPFLSGCSRGMTPRAPYLVPVLRRAASVPSPQRRESPSKPAPREAISGQCLPNTIKCLIVWSL